MPKQTRAQRTGSSTEERVERYLVRQGLQPVARNFHARGGEIDLIMRDGNTLVFVEVRYRSRVDYGDALASVDQRKQQRIIRAARLYLLRHPGREPPCRFDVVGVAPGRSPGTARVRWVRDAFGS